MSINDEMLDKIPGNEIAYMSIDAVADDEGGNGAMNYPEEFLNSYNSATLPKHKLLLKVGAPIILLRNLDPINGLCNGTRLIVTKLE